MPFTDTCRNIRLEGATLHADCKVAPGSDKHKPSTLSLDTIIGVSEGQLRWGLRDFSQHAKNIKLEGSQLCADVKTAEGKYVPRKLDLNSNIHNNKGTLEGLNIHRPTTPAKGHTQQDSITKSPDMKIDISKAKAAATTALNTSASDMSMSTSASSLFSATSAASSATSIHSTKTEKFEATSSSYSETKYSFEMGSKVQLSIRTTVKEVKLKGSILSGKCFHSATNKHVFSDLNLDTCIGFEEGKLVWGGKNFSRHCKSIHLRNWVLFVEFEDKAGHRHESTLNLWDCIHNINGEFIFVEVVNAKFSAMLSEVPWMKFRVIAEPDMSVFATHPVLKTTMAHIAQTTVEHVTMQMEEKITRAISEAVTSVTISAMSHIQKSLEVMVQEVAYGGVQGRAYGSATATEKLHILREGDRYFEAVNDHHHHHHHHGGRHHHHGSNGTNGNGADAGYFHTHIDYQVQDVSPAIDRVD